jgi:lysophospholipase L1-like esterase
VLASLTGSKVINAGRAGELSASGLQRLPGELGAYRPDLVILCHGGNDMLQQHDPAAVARNLDAMIRLANESGADVILLGVPEPGIFLGTASFYAELAAEYRIPYDGETVADILADGSLKSDYVHPNAAGYRRLAESVAALIRQHQAT